MSCRCKYRHVHFRQWTASNSDDASRACMFVSTKRARNSTFLPFTLLFLRPVISIERNPYFPACARFPRCACTTRVYVTHAPTHAHPHFESPLTHRGDISWNYGDSSRRSICHGFNVGLILLRLLDVTISFVQPRRARYPATGIGLRPKIRHSPVTGY